MPPAYSIDHLHLHLIMEPIEDFVHSYMTFGTLMRTIEKQIEILELGLNKANLSTIPKL